MNSLEFDFVVIGSGLSGSAAALALSPLGEVALMAKESANKSNSCAAQGGIAAAVGNKDSPRLHTIDTLNAGSNLCHRDAVEQLTKRAPQIMQWLDALGVPFDKDVHGNWHLGLEGAHGQRRILHAGGDATGRKIMEIVSAAVQQSGNIHVLEGLRVTSLVKNPQGRVIGADGENRGGRVLVLGRRGVILATGGAGQLYSRTTNPLGATGDGVALAYTAGAKVRNLEFVQFHPTALNTEKNPRFLVSEAVRGAGARLINAQGQFILAEHPLGDLAPRDAVSRHIYQHMQTNGEVYLDASSVKDFSSRFPTIYQACLNYGLNPLTEPIPVAPAAHFLMGGVAASMAGQTNVPGLYAIGEVANTGVHGANRLASNSLLECLVMAFQLAETFEDRSDSIGTGSASLRASSSNKVSLDIAEESIQPLSKLPKDALQKLQSLMWDHAGILRNKDSLASGLAELQALERMYPNSFELVTSSLILQSALLRKESRGAHNRTDFPLLSADLNFYDTVLTPRNPHEAVVR